ncbi:hypothetical protein SEA_WATERT_67 [Microbacterium phage WaterT]|nr:hypothetical protein SEA_WATERT_67 [Microbacterium phage WaterT]
MWAAGWAYPSKAKRAQAGRSYHLDNRVYESRGAAIERIGELRGEDGWYKGTKFSPVEVVFTGFHVTGPWAEKRA